MLPQGFLKYRAWGGRGQIRSAVGGKGGGGAHDLDQPGDDDRCRVKGLVGEKARGIGLGCASNHDGRNAWIKKKVECQQ